DRQFMTRSIDAARFVYRSADPQMPGPVVLGHHYQTPALRFEINFQPGTPVGDFIDAIGTQPDSPVYGGLLAHALHDFLSEHARAPVDPDSPPWAEQARPSTFTVRNLRTIILFHLLEQWHPPATANTAPAAPPRFHLDDLIGCFTVGHARYLDQ